MLKNPLQPETFLLASVHVCSVEAHLQLNLHSLNAGFCAAFLPECSLLVVCTDLLTGIVVRLAQGSDLIQSCLCCRSVKRQVNDGFAVGVSAFNRDLR